MSVLSLSSCSCKLLCAVMPVTSAMNGNVHDDVGQEHSVRTVPAKPLSSWSARELLIMRRHLKRCGPRRLRELHTVLVSSGHGGRKARDVRTAADVCAAIRELQTRADLELRRRVAAAARQPAAASISSGGAGRHEVPGDPLALWARRLRGAPCVGGPAMRLLAAQEKGARGCGLRAAYQCVGAALEARPAPPPPPYAAFLVRAALVQVAHRVYRTAPHLGPSRRLTAAMSRPSLHKTDPRAPRTEPTILASLLLQPDYNPLQLHLEDCHVFSL